MESKKWHALALLCWPLTHCWLTEELTPPLDAPSYCPADPTVACHDRGCVTPYECISYCLQLFPDPWQAQMNSHPGDAAPRGGEAGVVPGVAPAVPRQGPGSWCDDPRLPDFGDFCSTHRSVVGCANWCDDHPGRCGQTAPTVCNVPADCGHRARPWCDKERGLCVACTTNSHCHHRGEICHQGSCVECAPGRADLCPAATPWCHGETLACSECGRSADCLDQEASRCDRGSCSGCRNDQDCAHLAQTPVCVAGRCEECAPDRTAHCPVDRSACVNFQCEECATSYDCPSAAKPRCDGATRRCSPCISEADCRHVPGLPGCHQGLCMPCTRYGHCHSFQACNLATHRCVEGCQRCRHDGQCRHAPTLGEDFVCERDQDANQRRCFQQITSSQRAACDNSWLWFPEQQLCLRPAHAPCP
jgi:hypothetical protein